MGNNESSSSPQKLPRSQSYSSGFGRLRIDSPDYRLNSPTYQKLLSTIRQQRGENLGESNINGPFLRPSTSVDAKHHRIDSPSYYRTLLTQLRQQRDQGELGIKGQFLRSSPSDASDPIVEGTPLLNFKPGRELNVNIIDSGSIGSKLFEPGQDSPPLLQWIGPALLCALAYALYNIFIKKGSASIHPILGGVILQFVAAILGSVLCLSLVYGPTQEELFYDTNGVWYAICAGISVGAAEIISFMVSGMGVQAVQSIPTIIGGSVFFGTVLGWMLLNETLSVKGWLGVAMIAGGITLVGMDPGASMH